MGTLVTGPEGARGSLLGWGEREGEEDGEGGREREAQNLAVQNCLPAHKGPFLWGILSLESTDQAQRWAVSIKDCELTALSLQTVLMW